MAEPTRIQSPRTHPGASGERDAPARRLWSLWRQGQQPRVEDSLARDGVRDPGQLVEVLLVDQAERFRLGSPRARAGRRRGRGDARRGTRSGPIGAESGDPGATVAHVRFQVVIRRRRRVE